MLAAHEEPVPGRRTSNASSKPVPQPLEAIGPREGQELAPVLPSERIGALDMLRGWALFGVLWSNLNDWLGPEDPTTRLDSALKWSQWYLISGRFYTLLMLLFGIGFGIQMIRADHRGVDVRNTYYRRSAALLAIGILHGTLIARTDILASYAYVSFALILFRTANTRQLLAAAALLWFLGAPLVSDIKYLAGLRFLNPVPHTQIDYTLARGTWWEIEKVRVSEYFAWHQRWGLTSFPRTLAVFLMGFWAVKSGYFRRVVENSDTTRRLLAIALVAAVAGYLTDAFGDRVWPPFTSDPAEPLAFPYTTFQLNTLRNIAFSPLYWQEQAMGIAYACLLLLLWQRPLGARVLRPLAATGRMALTTYLVQSVVVTFLFHGWGLGWYGRVPYTRMLTVTLVLFSVQMLVSTLWLRRFRFGPVEWAWRVMTYGRLPT